MIIAFCLLCGTELVLLTLRLLQTFALLCVFFHVLCSVYFSLIYQATTYFALCIFLSHIRLPRTLLCVFSSHISGYHVLCSVYFSSHISGYSVLCSVYFSSHISGYHILCSVYFSSHISGYHVLCSVYFSSHISGYHILCSVYFSSHISGYHVPNWKVTGRSMMTNKRVMTAVRAMTPMMTQVMTWMALKMTNGWH